jgi:hypothetical protein
MEVNVSGTTMARLAAWVAAVAAILGIMIGAGTKDHAPASNTDVHPAGPPPVEAANDR